MKLNLSKTPSISVQSALLAGALLLSTPGFAASQCRGMPQDACAGTDQCIWVNGYTRKDGRSVASHCKARPVRQPADRAGLDGLKQTRTN